MNNKQHWFTKRSSPRLCFWLGIILGISIAVLAGISFIAYLYGWGKINLNKNNNFNLNIETEKNIIQDIPKKEVSFGEYTYYLGNVEAPTTLAVYTDYECEICRLYHSNVVSFINNHPDKAKLAVKNFVISQKHPLAESAAIAAICAGEQKKYFDYSNSLFNNQNLFNQEYFLKLAGDLSLDKTAFSQCLENKNVKNKVAGDYAEGINLGVSGIPSTIIIYPDKSLKLIDGNISIDFLESLLKDYL